MKLRYLLLSMPYALCLMPYQASAAVRVKNGARSYAGAYQQVNDLRAQEDYYRNQYANIQTPSSATVTNQAGVAVTLPVSVSNPELASQIADQDPATSHMYAQLENCARIYPDGEFAWTTPTAGAGIGGASTCTARIELRALNANRDGSDLVLAYGNVAAGSSIKCNISDFPEVNYTNSVSEYVFPADREPTMDDVISVMNSEQKQMAGLKIAAGAIIGGVGGNIAGKNEVGNDGLLGTGKDKMQSSVIGAVLGAGIAAGSAYTGKVTGDTILSAGVNAAAGGVIGNIMASGESVLRIENCKLDDRDTKCLWGWIVLSEEFPGLSDEILNCVSNSASSSKNAYYNIETGAVRVCECTSDKLTCNPADLVSIHLVAYDNKDLSTAKTDLFKKIKYDPDTNAYHLSEDGKMMEVGGNANADNIWALISSARKVSGVPIQAMIEYTDDKFFGAKERDWQKFRSDNLNNSNIVIYGRNARGQAGTLVSENYSLKDFSPMYLDATDGGIVDISNKARLKSTVTGAGVGGVLGGISGYAGAQQDIENRWLEAIRDYKDSKQKVVCFSGRRFMGFYNDEINIPQMTPIGE